MTTKDKLIWGVVFFLFGTLTCGLVLSRLHECPKPPDTSALVDSLQGQWATEKAELIHERNLLVRSEQFTREKYEAAINAIPATKKIYVTNAKAAYDSGLDALRDSLMSGPRD